MKIFLFSDSHFGLEAEHSPNSTRIKYFLEFLELVKEKGDMLCLVGDIFDFWFEYRAVIPKAYFPILKGLSNVADLMPVHFVMGNHDLWDDGFLETIGLKVHPSSLELQVGERKIYLSHGDLLTDTDFGGKLTRALLGNRLSVELYRLVHPDLGIAVAKLCSRLSRTRSETKQPEKIVPTPAHRLFEKGYDAVILGHTHFPYLVEISGKIFMYIGDWLGHFTYGVVDDTSVHLVHFKDGKEKALEFGPPTLRGKST